MASLDFFNKPNGEPKMKNLNDQDLRALLAADFQHFIFINTATTAQVMDACLRGTLKPMEVYKAWTKQFREKPTKTVASKMRRLLSTYKFIQCEISDEDIKLWSEHI